MADIFSIILANGSGERLWPVSGKLLPDDLVGFFGGFSVFQRTFMNLAEFTDDRRIIPVTNVELTSSVKQDLKILREKFGRENDYRMVIEPEYKGTLSSLAVAVKYIKKLISFSVRDAVILSVPYDNLLLDRKTFERLVFRGAELAKAGYIVSFSCETTEIDSSAGYFKARKNPKVNETDSDALKVTSYIHKPDTKEKKSQLKGKLYLNSGMYMFTVETFMSELEQYHPGLYNLINDAVPENTVPSVEMSVYDKIEPASFDEVIVENSKKIVTVPFEKIWKNAGSWNSVYEMCKKDSSGNYFGGNVFNMESEDSFVYSPDKLTAVMGLKNKNVIVTEDAVFVSDRRSSSAVKAVYEKLGGKNTGKKDIHKTVHRPWGYYTVLEDGGEFLTKCITVNPGAKLSVQKHLHRSEHWIVLEGEATVLKGERTYVLNPGESIDIDIEEIHSLQNAAEEQLKILEVQQGDILDENDIIRLEDIYGRV